MNTIYLALAVAYTLYFIWLISSQEQEARHLQELSDADPEARADLSVNDYFFEDNYKD